MFYAYVLKSIKDNGIYIGFTSNLKKRYKEHNNGQSLSTKNRRPFRLVYYEAYFSATDARKRELNLKQFKNSYTELKKRLVNSLK